VFHTIRCIDEVLRRVEMKRRVSASDRQSYAVMLRHEERGELGEGVLSFGEGHLTSVTFKSGPPAALCDGERIDLVKAVTDSGRTYTLCTCIMNGFALYADYVIEADIAVAEFDQIVVRYSEVSEWFLHWQNIKGHVGEQLTWAQISKPLSVAVSTDEGQFTLTSDYVGTRDVLGEDLVLHEHVEFSFMSSGGQFGLSDLKTKTLELSCLLSILIGYPATIISVYVSLNDGRFGQVRFPTFERPERDMTDSGFWIKFFIQKPQIEDRWQTIFEHYYRSKYRKVCWVRLAGMQRYDGFWEYKALGYVSLLDSYVTIRSEDVARPAVVPPSAKKLAAFRRAVVKAIPPLSDVQCDEFTEIASRVFASEPDFNFGQKYRLAMAETDPDIVRIISLSDADFRLIKKIRDRIAHGDDHGLREEQFAQVSSTVAKIALFLTYWAFLDFGLTTDDFVKCLNSTHSALRFSSRLDNVHLARVTGSSEFFPVTKEKFDELARVKGIRVFACFIRDADGELNFSEKHTTMYKDWQSSPSRPSGIQQPSDIFGVDNDAARVVGHGYFECGEERLEVHHMWIIDQSRIVALGDPK
jgi:hypothetical protein